MKMLQVLAVALTVIGLFGLVYGGFIYTPEHREVRRIDSLGLNVQTVGFPIWAGTASIALGAVMLVVPGVRR